MLRLEEELTRFKTSCPVLFMSMQHKSKAYVANERLLVEHLLVRTDETQTRVTTQSLLANKDTPLNREEVGILKRIKDNATSAATIAEGVSLAAFAAAERMPRLNKLGYTAWFISYLSSNLPSFLTTSTKENLLDEADRELLPAIVTAYQNKPEFKRLYNELSRTPGITLPSLEALIQNLLQKFNVQQLQWLNKLAEMKEESTTEESVSSFFSATQQPNATGLSAAQAIQRYNNNCSVISIAQFLTARLLGEETANKLQTAAETFNKIDYNVNLYRAGTIGALALTGNFAQLATTILNTLSGTDGVSQAKQQLSKIGDDVLKIHKDMIAGFEWLAKGQHEIQKGLEDVLAELKSINADIQQIKNILARLEEGIKKQIDIFREEYKEDKCNDAIRATNLAHTTLSSNLRNSEFDRIDDRLNELVTHATVDARAAHFTGRDYKGDDEQLINNIKLQSQQDIFRSYNLINQVLQKTENNLSLNGGVVAALNPRQWAYATDLILQVVPDILEKVTPESRKMSLKRELEKHATTLWNEGLELLRFTNIAGNKILVKSLSDKYAKAAIELTNLISADLRAGVSLNTIKNQHQQKWINFNLTGHGLRFATQLNILRQVDKEQEQMHLIDGISGIYSSETLLRLIEESIAKPVKTIFEILSRSFSKTTEISLMQTVDLSVEKSLPVIQNTLLQLAAIQSIYLPDLNLISVAEILNKIENTVTEIAPPLEKMRRKIRNNTLSILDFSQYPCDTSFQKQPAQLPPSATSNKTFTNARLHDNTPIRVKINDKGKGITIFDAKTGAQVRSIAMTKCREFDYLSPGKLIALHNEEGVTQKGKPTDFLNVIDLNNDQKTSTKSNIVLSTYSGQKSVGKRGKYDSFSTLIALDDKHAACVHCDWPLGYTAAEKRQYSIKIFNLEKGKVEKSLSTKGIISLEMCILPNKKFLLHARVDNNKAQTDAKYCNGQFTGRLEAEQVTNFDVWDMMVGKKLKSHEIKHTKMYYLRHLKPISDSQVVFVCAKDPIDKEIPRKGFKNWHIKVWCLETNKEIFSVPIMLSGDNNSLPFGIQHLEPIFQEGIFMGFEIYERESLSYTLVFPANISTSELNPIVNAVLEQTTRLEQTGRLENNTYVSRVSWPIGYIDQTLKQSIENCITRNQEAKEIKPAAPVLPQAVHIAPNQVAHVTEVPARARAIQIATPIILAAPERITQDTAPTRRTSQIAAAIGLNTIIGQQARNMHQPTRTDVGSTAGATAQDTRRTSQVAAAIGLNTIIGQQARNMRQPLRTNMITVAETTINPNAPGFGLGGH